MTDTGQVPGEGLPESAGMVEQPGVPASTTYAYLSENPAEDEDLLLPGSHGAWGNEVPPPAPEPVVEAFHAPGPHELSGRDTGSVDLGGVLHPGPPGAAPGGQPAPRRPLHLGPPLPDSSASPVRSLADRGPAGVRARQPAPAAAAPEPAEAVYPGEAVPQGAAPWGAPGQAPVPAPAGAQGPAAETVAPAAAPADPAPARAALPQPVPPPAAAEPAGDPAGRPEPGPEAVPSAPEGAQPAPGGPESAAGHAPDAASATGPAGPPAEAAATGSETGPEGAYAAGATPADAAPAGQLPPLTAAVPGQALDAAVARRDRGPDAPRSSGALQGPEALRGPEHTPAAEQAPYTETAPGAPAGSAPETEAAPLPQPPAAPDATATPFDGIALPADAAPQPGDTATGTVTPQPVPAGGQPQPDAVPSEPQAAPPAPQTAAAEAGSAPVPDGTDPALLQGPQHPEADTTPADRTGPDQGADRQPVAGPAAPAPDVLQAPHPVEHAAPAAPDAVAGPGEAPEEHGPGAPVPAAVPLQAQPGQPIGRFVPVEGTVPSAPHLAPTPPHPLVLPAESPAAQDPEAAGAPDVPAVTVPAPRGADTVPAAPAAEPETEVVQHADDLHTQVADQEESTAPVAEAQQSTGPAAPGFDDAEREAVLRVIRERRDIRNGFRSDPIPHEVLLRVLEAAHTAPSVGHSQPWDFVVIRSADTRQAMHELAMRQREAYAKSLPKGRAKQFKELKIEAILDTPVNIVVTADPTRGGRHTLGRHTQPQMAPYSSALAVENLWLAARAEGLGVGWVSFFDEREMVRELGLPEHLEVVAYLCVGYVDEFPGEPELMQAGWSKRRPLSWVVHEETYGRRALPGEDPHDLLGETVAQIRPLDAKALGEAWERQKRMTKPAGALGMLEIISAQLSGLSRQCPPPIPEPAAVAIFAGDHGVHAQGVTPWPQEVTGQMVANFLGGGAVCNAFAAQVGAEVCVIDVGVATDLPATPGLLPRKVRAGTSDMTAGPAMTREEAKQAIEVGIETARDLVAAGNKALLTGEMGIANTTASAALISVFTGADPAEVTGRGTGINDETLARKTEVVRRALELHQPDPADPIGVLAALGGFEHAAMVGLLLGGASLRTPVILDGVSAGAAALVARAVAPEVLAACIAGHRSAEPGHVAALNKLGLRPLVDLDLRLGEGTGALLALPLVQSTARAMHEVATFDSAGVTEK
ncbi:nicotinate-nucleotide--dimethylbenzimidazole phosphoribosyltransferase [Streptomyces tropicalis]|uniref:Nicotinate-nucleotide--dimethylbenzimidazole phosphoribosyltransferase n=1 Tax=Streptomyces tropicalis TaxID=3034234 RepID=A0ABT6A527_9ACTN|nr:nicotinate-nucleotide--dimethylbenzimidazole phosphoribosyltransferase [Streptomyces tropicalis]MDF3299756.1 nicotinate-nucleotide--dimethylbenzimidazole phosphoribosyltransferase [Streptomyces tropicalis]